MNERRLTWEQITNYGWYLRGMERSRGTVEKCLRDVQAFMLWSDGKGITRELAADWKEHLRVQGYAPSTVNSMLAALNGLFRFMGWEDCRVKFLKIQRRLLRDLSRELSRAEYEHLLKTARERGQERLALLIEEICATGIRVSEVKYLTVEAARQGRTDVSLKGKIRTILLPSKLCRKLLQYAKNKKPFPARYFSPKTEEA